MSQGENGVKKGSAWTITKEKILLWVGVASLACYIGAFIAFHEKFPIEFLLLIAAMFGLSIAGWGDKK